MTTSTCIMSFGLKNTQTSFQCLMNDIFTAGVRRYVCLP